MNQLIVGALLLVGAAYSGMRLNGSSLRGIDGYGPYRQVPKQVAQRLDGKLRRGCKYVKGSRLAMCRDSPGLRNRIRGHWKRTRR